jgi:F-type H+-transporting ATPase subunit c
MELKFIAIGLLAIAMAGSALAIGKIFSSLFESIARNPSATPQIQKYVYVAAAFAEMIALLAAVIAFILIFK